MQLCPHFNRCVPLLDVYLHNCYLQMSSSPLLFSRRLTVKNWVEIQWNNFPPSEMKTITSRLCFICHNYMHPYVEEQKRWAVQCQQYSCHLLLSHKFSSPRSYSDCKASNATLWSLSPPFQCGHGSQRDSVATVPPSAIYIHQRHHCTSIFYILHVTCDFSSPLTTQSAPLSSTLLFLLFFNSRVFSLPSRKTTRDIFIGV